jgi:hypothetical protein
MTDGRVTKRLAANAREREVRNEELGWLRRLVRDLRTIGVVGEACLGCGKVICDGCPAGTGTMIVPASLSVEARKRFEDLHHPNNEFKKPNPAVHVDGIMSVDVDIAATVETSAVVVALGGHDYSVITHRRDCAFGCGAWMDGSRSDAPAGIDLLGVCPKNPANKPIRMKREGQRP